METPIREPETNPRTGNPPNLFSGCASADDTREVFLVECGAVLIRRTVINVCLYKCRPNWNCAYTEMRPLHFLAYLTSCSCPDNDPPTSRRQRQTEAGRDEETEEEIERWRHGQKRKGTREQTKGQDKETDTKERTRADRQTSQETDQGTYKGTNSETRWWTRGLFVRSVNDFRLCWHNDASLWIFYSCLRRSRRCN